jgi:hypothetical protein
MSNGVDVKSNFGAFAKYGDLASGKTLEALDAVGAFVGLIADIGGVIGLAAWIAQVLQSNSQTVDLTQQELTVIDQNLRNLIASEQVDHLLERLRGLDAIAAPAQKALEMLPSSLPPNPPLSTDAKNGYIGDCVQALDSLASPDHWIANALETSYYDDGGEWAGRIAPDAPGGVAFSTKHILPTFLRCLCYFISVGTIYDSNFIQNQKDRLQTYLNRLQTAYDTAKQGIWALPRPAKEDVLVQHFGALIWSPGPWQVGLQTFAGEEGETIPVFLFHSTFYRLYGVVSRYGEYFKVGNYPPAVNDSSPLNLPAAPPVPLYPDFAKFYATYDLKIIAARKVAYRELGLGITRKAINGLRAIAEGNRIIDFDPDMWFSLREISGPLASAFPDDPANPPFVRVTLGRAISRLNALSGTTQQSLRNAFEAVVLPILLSPLQY